MNVTTLMEYVSYLLVVIGILAFLVAAITQAVKEMPKIKELPTAAVALALSLILCPVVLLALCQYFSMKITWYMVIASIIIAFIVYLVATGGWAKIKEIWERTKYQDNNK